MLLKKEEKEQLVIEMALDGKTTREIAKAVHISLKDIGTIIRKFTGEELSYSNKTPSVTSKAFQMFQENKNRVDVAIALGLEADDVIVLFEDYLKLQNLDKLFTIYRDLGNEIYMLDYLSFNLKQEGSDTKQAISRFVEMVGRLARLDEEELKICEQIGRLNLKKFALENEIDEALKELEQYNVSLREKQLL